MENALLFILAQLRNWRAGSVVAVIGSTWNQEPVSTDHTLGQKESILTALEAIELLYEKDNV